jgi:hypothetical protein
MAATEGSKRPADRRRVPIATLCVVLIGAPHLLACVRGGFEILRPDDATRDAPPRDARGLESGDASGRGETSHGDGGCSPRVGLAHWPFDEAASDLAHDASCRGYDGVLVGTPTWSAGHAGSALHFGGNTRWVSVADSSNLKISSVFSIEAWARTTSYSAYRVIVDKSETDRYEYWFGYSPDDVLCIILNPGDADERRSWISNGIISQRSPMELG